MNKKIYIILLLLFLSLFFLVGCQNSNTENNYSTNRTTYETQPEPVEEELYTFSTPIKSEDPNRLTNLKITSSKIMARLLKQKKNFLFMVLLVNLVVKMAIKKLMLTEKIMK